MEHVTEAREVLAKRVATWVENDGGLYDYVDKLINDLWRAGYRIIRARYPLGDADDSGASLFLALNVPGLDSAAMDPDEIADDFAACINEGMSYDSGRITVSAIPAPQWLTPETLVKLRQDAS